MYVIPATACAKQLTTIPATPPAVSPTLPRSVPTLTVYADGLVNLNSEATALLLAIGEAVDLHKPRPHRQNVGNPRRPNLWEISIGTTHRLLGREDRITVARFKAGKQAPPPARYLLTPIAGQPERFTLVPF
jgi:hypothetical protein